METLADPLARDRRGDEIAIVTADGRERSYRELITNAYRGGNALRHDGVRGGSEVGIAPVADLPSVLAFLGAGLLGARVRFDVPASCAAGARAIVVPTAEASSLDVSPATRIVAFGPPPKDPQITHWESDVWSENPAFPPTDLDPDDPLLVAGRTDQGDGNGNENGNESEDEERFITHGRAISGAAIVVERYGLGPGSRVVLHRSLAHPGTVVAGLIAPLISGATAVLRPPGDEPDEPDGDLSIGDGPEPETIDPEDVPV